MCGKQITKEDSLFYLDMINSVYSPSHKPEIGQYKGYYELLKQQDSKDYITFICVYLYFREALSEREKAILDLQYRVNGNILSIKEIGECIGISSSRVSQIRNKAEHKIAKEIQVFLYGEKPRKKSFYSIIQDQPDKLLIEIGQVTRSWDAIIKYYFDQECPRYYKKRKKLEKALDRMWNLDALDHRQQAIKILNIKTDAVY